MPVLIDIFRATSSSSQSVTAEPSLTLPSRGVIPAVNSNDDTSWVFPVSPWPAMPTLRIHSVLYDFMFHLAKELPLENQSRFGFVYAIAFVAAALFGRAPFCCVCICIFWRTSTACCARQTCLATPPPESTPFAQVLRSFVAGE